LLEKMLKEGDEYFGYLDVPTHEHCAWSSALQLMWQLTQYFVAYS
jgi:hypothetical protein